jgi:hypothetical protein
MPIMHLLALCLIVWLIVAYVYLIWVFFCLYVVIVFLPTYLIVQEVNYKILNLGMPRV